MPTQTDVQTHVLNFLNAFSGISQSDFQNKFMDTKLTDPPLSFDGPSLSALTLSLRGYIQNVNPAGTILAGDVKADGLTVKALIALVFSKVK